MGKLEYILVVVVLIFAIALAFSPLGNSTGASVVDMQSEQIIEHTTTDSNIEYTEATPAEKENAGVKAGKIYLTAPDEVNTENDESEKIQSTNEKYIVAELTRNRGMVYGYVRNVETGKKYPLEITNDHNIEEFEYVNVLEWKSGINGKMAIKVKEI